MGSTSTTSITIATAEATGQSRFEKNSFHSTEPIISVFGPPSSAGITNSPTAGMKTSSAPAMIPGSDSGSVTVRKVTKGRAPRSAEASSSASSSFTSVE